MGRKNAGEEHEWMCSYEIPYEPGELKAVGYTQGNEAGQDILVTAGRPAILKARADRRVLKADVADLSYITVNLADEEGRLNLWAEKEITVSVEGAGTLQGFGSADPATENRYDNTTWKTYDGYLLAAIRSGKEAGKIKVTFTADGCEAAEVMLTVDTGKKE